jgi:choline dehydrogenase-like flavoprotein
MGVLAKDTTPNGHVRPGVAGAPLITYWLQKIENLDDLAKYRKRELAASDFVWTVFHPLGTAQMGHDPRRSVVSFDHETHDVQSLFIVDGSTVPGPTAVNPQLTIMAMADRAAGRIGQRL